MRRTVCLFILAILFIGGVAYSQNADNWYLDKPITEIRFVGLSNVSESELAALTAQFIGKKFQNSLWFDLQTKLYALDYFEYFEPEAIPANDEKTAVIIQFKVVEHPVIDRIELEGNQFVRRQDILDEILIKIGDLGTTARVRADSELIKSLYLERGFPDVTVSGKIDSLTDTTAKVVFTITEGVQRKVAEIRFSGNSFASPSTLKRLISTKEQSLFASGVFQESRLAEDAEKILTYYHNRGYIDARVVDIVREIQDEEGKNNMILTYYIEEGVQYTYGGMEFVGNSLYSDERLQSEINQREGAILSRTKLESDYYRVQSVYMTDGYIYNTWQREELRDEENRIITYRVNIVESGRARIENIILNGNEKTTDEVILRELPFEPGDIYSQPKLIQGYQNLLNLQYFSTVIPNYSPGSADGLIDIIFDLEEGRTTDINFGLNFAGATEDFPVQGFLKWTDSNFLGKGQEFSIGSQINLSAQSLTFAFKENWLAGRRWSGGIDLSAEHNVPTNIQQDILGPVFDENDPNRVPDPYTGIYVWAEDNTSGKTPGTPFAGTAAELPDLIASGEVITDYAYDVSQKTAIDSGYLMKYDSYDLSLGLSTGYTFTFPSGRLGLGTRLNTTLSYVDYDRTLYRPYDVTVRDNWHRVLPVSTWVYNVTWDSRDIYYNPTSGVYLRESVTLAGGFLPSTRDYIRSNTKAQAFFKLFDVPVLDNWNFKGVLALSSSISFIFNQFMNIDDPEADAPYFNVASTDLLRVDGMTMARGWDPFSGQRALWNSGIELRMPIVEQYVWFDLFLDGTGAWPTIGDFASMEIDDYLFGFGGGARLTIPGLPIGLYLTKRFKFDNGAFVWQTGNILANENVPGSGIDLVLAFSAELF